MKSDQRIVELDGLRGIAVAMVLAWHFIGQTMLSSTLPYAKYLSSVFIFGRAGVDLFFVLSGFLIIGILMDQRGSAHLFRVFYLRRASRILPPYLLLLAVFAATAPYLGDQSPQGVPLWSFLLFLQNWFMSFANNWGPSAISVTWSVAIEEQFYLVFPAILLLTPTRHLRNLLIAIATMSALGRALLYFTVPSATFAPYVNTVFRLDGLCIGGVLATVYREPRLLGILEASKYEISRVTIYASLLIIPLIVGINSNIQFTMYVFGHSYLALFFGAVLLLVLLYRGTRKTSLLKSKGLLFLGAVSYSLYLFHPIIITCFFRYRERLEQLSNQLDGLTLLSAFGASLIFCWALQFLERKFIGFGHKFKYQDAHSKQAATASN